MDAVDHVVLGAGAVGLAVAEALARRGESVRVVNRSGLREPIAGIQSVRGEVTDSAFAASATRGARVVYQALNPPYHRWAQEFPRLQAAAIDAAQSLIGDRVIPPALADKRASVMGNPDMPHTYTFIPDIGENLVRLGERDDALGRIWHLPSPETRTTRDVIGLVYRAAGTKPRLKVTPAWQMRALGLVNRTVREINEMSYEFDEPFIVDATRSETELGLRATPLADAVEQTVRWYRDQAIPPAAAGPKRTERAAAGAGSN